MVNIEEFEIKDSYNLEKQFFLRQDQEKNYNIKPFKDFQLNIAGNTYDVSLEEAKSLELNTDGDENINIKSFDFYSSDMKKIGAEFNGDKGIINLEFDKNLDTTNIEISYPDFVMNGNWIIKMK
ncbi:hypothetical protein IZY60_13275 [Lutibacter sp. B2]|nr:hypothetical protein [Lutibacter sp. B2]